MSRLALIALVLLGGCATAETRQAQADRRAKAEVEIADTLKGLTAEEPRDCIDQTRVNSIQTFAGTILYKYSPREIYRNNVSGGCFGLAHGDIVVTRTPTTRLCRGEIIQTVAPGANMPSGSCALGEFIPYTR